MKEKQCYQLSGQPHILIVDNAPRSNFKLKHFLERNGFSKILVVRSMKDAYTILRGKKISLVILNIRQPVSNWLSYIESSELQTSYIKDDGILPILVLFTRVESGNIQESRSSEYHANQPYYPFSLITRIHAILNGERHIVTNPRHDVMQRNIHFGKFTLSMPSRVVIGPDQQRITLTNAELKLLQYFLDNPNQPLSRKIIIKGVKGCFDAITERAIDVQISRLRRRLGDYRGSIIKTLRNDGYILTTSISLD